MVTRKLEWETGLSDSESATRFAIGSTVPPVWLFPGWHFAHSDRNGAVGLVNGSVGTVTNLDTRPVDRHCLFRLVHRAYHRMHSLTERKR